MWMRWPAGCRGSGVSPSPVKAAAIELGLAVSHDVDDALKAGGRLTAMIHTPATVLDGDRFEGRFRDGVHSVEPGDLMRRMVKENLLKFDAKPLFPERIEYPGGQRIHRQARLFAEVALFAHLVEKSIGRPAPAQGRGIGLSVGLPFRHRGPICLKTTAAHMNRHPTLDHADI